MLPSYQLRPKFKLMATQEFIEDYRRASLSAVRNMPTFEKCWPIWNERMSALTDGWINAEAIFNLGSHLTDVFALTATKGRGQGEVSGGGAAWEGLVCWYLNLILSGTRAVALKQRASLLPECIRDAGTISYGSFRTNTESDLLILVIPSSFQSDKTVFKLSDLQNHMAGNFAEAEMHVIQCKTNWNDNAQIPMLWDMIYRARSFADQSVTIGRNGYSVSRLKRFSYSFVTMPSQKGPIKAGSMAVNRVAKLSGGNFWGRPSKQGVALSLSEIFNRNLADCFDTDIKTHVREMIQNGLRTHDFG